MDSRWLLCFALLPSLLYTEDIPDTSVTTTRRNDTGRVLSRRKRYLTFPEGSTFSFAFCMELKTVTQDIDIFTEGVAVAANYDLPSKPDQLFTVKPRPPAPVIQRRHRRSLYTRMEKVFNILSVSNPKYYVPPRAGLDGRSCVLRALCEAAQQFIPRVGMLEEILRTIFLVPMDGMTSEEPREHWLYRTAYRSGTQNLNCQNLYPRCPLSLLSLLMTLEPANLFYK